MQSKTMTLDDALECNVIERLEHMREKTSRRTGILYKETIMDQGLYVTIFKLREDLKMRPSQPLC
jgi:hypothetical protein